MDGIKSHPSARILYLRLRVGVADRSDRGRSQVLGSPISLFPNSALVSHLGATSDSARQPPEGPGGVRICPQLSLVTSESPQAELRGSWRVRQCLMQWGGKSCFVMGVSVGMYNDMCSWTGWAWVKGWVCCCSFWGVTG